MTAKALARDPSAAELSEADRAMVDYAILLTRSPHAVDADSVARLRAVGFTDTALLDICQVVSYYNYVNRLADGLGVELESSWTEGEMTLTRAEFEQRTAARHTSQDPE